MKGTRFLSRNIRPLAVVGGLLILFISVTARFAMAVERDGRGIVGPEAGDTEADIGRSAWVPLLWEFGSGKADMPLQTLVDESRALLYVARKGSGVEILQLRNPSPPMVLSGFPKMYMANLDAVAIARSGNLLYVALGDIFAHRLAKSGLATLDVSEPKNPKILSLWQSPQATGGSSSILIHDGMLYLGAMSAGVIAFDLHNTEHPTYKWTFQPDPKFPNTRLNRVSHPNVRALTATGNQLFVCYDAGGLRTIDISDPSAPRETGRYINAKLLGQQQAYNGIALAAPYAFLTCDYAGVEVVDIANPADIKQVGWWDPWRKSSGGNFWFGSKGHANQIQYDDRSKSIYVSAGDSELVVLDVNDPRSPQVRAHYGKPKDKAGAWGITLSNGIAYVTYIRAFIPFHSTYSGIKALSCRQ